MKNKLPEWQESGVGLTVTDISQMPKNTIGFVYYIQYMDGMKYIGKKNIFATKTLKGLKSGKTRPNIIDRVYKNTGKGFRQAFDIIRVESNWKDYTGSHKEAKIRIPKYRTILQYAKTNLQLTYLEAKWLFKESVLERDDYINDNILGKFYRNVNDG